MNQPKAFQALITEEKINFFVKCQELLINHHPNSQFLLKKENLEEKKHFILEFIKKYKGFTYYDDNVCILFNKIFIKDERDPIGALKDHLYQEPQENYNTYSVDFVVFRYLTDCIEFCRSQYTEQIKYLLFVKNNEVKLYRTEKLLTRLTNVPLTNFQLKI